MNELKIDQAAFDNQINHEPSEPHSERYVSVKEEYKWDLQQDLLPQTLMMGEQRVGSQGEARDHFDAHGVDGG